MAGYNLTEGRYENRKLSDDEMWSAFSNLFSSHSKNSSSYKFGFLKAIMDNLYNVDQNLTLTFDQLFGTFTEVYWNLVLKYGIRQQPVSEHSNGTYLEQALNLAAVKYAINEENPFESISDEAKIEVCKKIKSKCKINVVGALFGDTKGFFYSFSRREEWLQINPQMYQFVCKHKLAIEKLNYYEWAKYLERINDDSVMDHLLTKIDKSSERENLSIYRRILFEEFENDSCFYCGKKLSNDGQKVHVDHFVPRAFIKDDKMWNLVLACPTSADTYQKVMNYFKPKLWLGMTATPDKRDDNSYGKNIYEIFNYQIAYEIRLQQAMEENMLCPFHYFGISDVSLLSDKEVNSKKISERDFNMLTGTERVRHIIEQANYYGYSGDKVKGLIFCSRIDESIELSNKFNQIVNPETGKHFRTIALNGDASEEERQSAFERLAMNEEDATNGITPLDYIFSVEILNEGVDIVEVNQVIMLRPTESPIVFIQQLGRGLRKAEGKEYVVILDFIGNYNNNFMIPIALSGDRSYNPDSIRKYVISGNNTIPGASTVHFDEIAKDKIFASIDKIKGMKTIIRDSYVSLKNRLGRVPYLLDFYENGEIDPLVIIKEYKTYQYFLESVENETHFGKINEEEQVTLEYLSKTILSGTRPYELEILRRLLKDGTVKFEEFSKEFRHEYGYAVDLESFDNAVEVLQGRFVSKEDEYKKYRHIDIVSADENRMLNRLEGFEKRITHEEFYKQVDDIVEVGLRKYAEKYEGGVETDSPFVLYEKYSRRDVSLLMNCGKDLSSTMYGMKRIGDDVFIFVTYHKESANDEKNYVEGKPDYADAFEDNVIFKWDSQIGRGVDSSYMEDVCTAARKHLLVKKSDSESNFYYMGLFDIVDVKADKKKDNNGKDRDIAKLTMKMQHPVRDDLLRYLQSNITGKEDEKVG